MIVQSSDSGRHLVLDMDQHTTMAGRFAAHFGNEVFEPVTPRELMIFVVAHHDAGWAPVDATNPRDPKTGLPYNLVQTPIPRILATSKGSPDLNEAHHAFCGLISSMHTTGLYTGRYGLSDKVFVDMVPEDVKPELVRFLGAEETRRASLIETLRASPDTATWADEAFLFHCYKQLQFFDTLALYFHTTHAAARQPTTFANVPRAVGDDVTIAVTPKGQGRYAFDPFPFDTPGVEVPYTGRWVEPQPEGVDMPSVVAAGPLHTETVVLEAG